MLRVWVDAWQLQCCGVPFAVGDTVRWTLVERLYDDVLHDRRGRREVVRLAHAEDHHVDAPEDAPVTEGRVRRVLSVTYERTPLPGQRGTFGPRAGSGRVQERRRADGWESDLRTDDARYFTGYVVDLDAAPPAGR